VRWRAAYRWWLTQRCRKRAEPGGWQSAGPAGRTVFGLHRAFLLATGLAPAAGLTFLCFAKEKISKRKASQRPCPCGVPCATRAARGRTQTRYAQTAPALIRSPLRCSARPMAQEARIPRVLVRCAHLAHASRRAARAVVAAVASATTSKTTTAPTAAAVPSTNPLTTTASFPNSGQQTSNASSRTNTPFRPKKTKLAVQAPLHPGGGEGAGGKRGAKQRETSK